MPHRYTEFEVVNGDLVISLTSDGTVAIEAAEADGQNLDADSFMHDLFEWPTGNGWEWIGPEEVGALTSAPILSDSAERDDDGRLTNVGRIFWFPNYQVESSVQRLQSAARSPSRACFPTRRSVHGASDTSELPRSHPPGIDVMPREMTITVYRFNELSADAKRKAKDKHAALFGYAWADEAIQSLRKLAEHFGGRLADYNIDFFQCGPSSARFAMPDDMDGDDIASRLDALGTYNPETLKGHGDCKLTGFCADEDAIDGFRKAFHEGEGDLQKLMDAAFGSWLRAAQDDCENQYSDEQFSEHADINAYEYEKNGRLAR